MSDVKEMDASELERKLIKAQPTLRYVIRDGRYQKAGRTKTKKYHTLVMIYGGGVISGADEDDYSPYRTYDAAIVCTNKILNNFCNGLKLELCTPDMNPPSHLFLIVENSYSAQDTGVKTTVEYYVADLGVTPKTTMTLDSWVNLIVDNYNNKLLVEIAASRI